MVERRRLLAAALVVAAGVALFTLGSGPGAPGGTVATNAVPAADVTVAPGEAEPGTVTVGFASAGDWETATLTVGWNASLTVAEGDRRLEAVGETVTLAERTAAGATPVRVTVTATGDGRARTVYRRTVWV